MAGRGPFVFASHAEERGYKWVRHRGEWWMVPIAGPDEFSHTKRTYPLEEPALYLACAELFTKWGKAWMKGEGWTGGEDGPYLEFANQHGMLGIGERVKIRGIGEVFAERYTDWVAEVTRLWVFSDLWDSQKEGTIQCIQSRLDAIGRPQEFNAPIDAYDSGYVRVSAGMEPGAFRVANRNQAVDTITRVVTIAINNMLTDRTQYCAVDMGNGRVELYGRPKDLLGCLWLQFAQHLERGSEVRRCPACGSHYVIDPQLGTRRHRKYCSQSCRVAAYRTRQEDRQQVARKLAAKGLKPGEIAKKIGDRVTAAMVRAWLKS